MKSLRFVCSFVLAVAFVFGVSSFVPVGACGGTMPGSCRDGQALNADMTLVWLETGRILVGLFG